MAQAGSPKHLDSRPFASDDHKLTPKKADVTWRDKFLRRLAATGNVTAACRSAKISRQTAYNARAEDPHFAAAWDEALIVATELLELEARRRAEKGVLDPIYFQGQQVGKIRRYSDTLLIFLLKAHAPEKYRERLEVDQRSTNTNASVTVYLPDNRRDDRDD